MSKHMGARHDDGLGAMRGLVSVLLGWIVVGLVVALVAWL